MNFCKNIARMARVSPNFGWCNFLIAENRNHIQDGFKNKTIEENFKKDGFCGTLM